MAGAGYKLFQTGDVLTAAQVNTYLNEQTVMVFANAAARTTALTSVLAEGMVSYLQDTNAVEVYNGTAWVGVSGAGDVTEIQAGVGISVASGTGPIPVITNSSTDLITTAGDLLYGTAADTVARLGIGTAGQVLKVNSGATAPEWGAAAAGGLTELATGSLTGTTVSLTSISQSYKQLRLVLLNASLNTSGHIQLQFNSDTGGNYYFAKSESSAADIIWSGASGYIVLTTDQDLNTSTIAAVTIDIFNYTTSNYKTFSGSYIANRNNVGLKAGGFDGGYASTTAITTMQIAAEGVKTFDNGTYTLYGVN